MPEALTPLQSRIARFLLGSTDRQLRVPGSKTLSEAIAERLRVESVSEVEQAIKVLLAENYVWVFEDTAKDGERVFSRTIGIHTSAWFHLEARLTDRPVPPELDQPADDDWTDETVELLNLALEHLRAAAGLDGRLEVDSIPAFLKGKIPELTRRQAGVLNQQLGKLNLRTTEGGEHTIAMGASRITSADGALQITFGQIEERQSAGVEEPLTELRASEPSPTAPAEPAFDPEPAGDEPVSAPMATSEQPEALEPVPETPAEPIVTITEPPAQPAAGPESAPAISAVEAQTIKVIEGLEATVAGLVTVIGQLETQVANLTEERDGYRQEAAGLRGALQDALRRQVELQEQISLLQAMQSPPTTVDRDARAILARRLSLPDPS